MNKREMENLDLKDAFPEMPQDCRDALLRAARSVKEEKNVKYVRFTFKTALIAALLILSMTAVALAASGALGWSDFLGVHFGDHVVPSTAVNAMNLEPGSEVVATFRSLQVEFLGAAQEPNATVIEASESEECPPNAPSASASPCSSAYAMAKTPEVGLLPSQKPDIPDDNVFSAIVEEIWQGETEAKILLSLAGGSVTMILPNNVLSIAPGQLVRIRIAPEAVDVRSMPGMRIEKT